MNEPKFKPATVKKEIKTDKNDLLWMLVFAVEQHSATFDVSRLRANAAVAYYNDNIA